MLTIAEEIDPDFRSSPEAEEVAEVAVGIVTAGNQAAAQARLDLLVERGLVTEPIPECDLVAHGVIGAQSRGWLMTETGDFRGDRAGDAGLSRSELLALVADPEDRLTFTCTPWGSGERIALDRDEDGVLNGDE